MHLYDGEGLLVDPEHTFKLKPEPNPPPRKPTTRDSFASVTPSARNDLTFVFNYFVLNEP